MMKIAQFALLLAIFGISWPWQSREMPAREALIPGGRAETALAAPKLEPELQFPIRAAFYYPWFPQGWDQNQIKPFTHYHPTLGYYSEDNPQVIQEQIAAMKYGKIQAGIASWWGQKHYTDGRIPALLQAGEKANFYWALYYESEGYGNPTVDAIRADLQYIRDHYASSPAYLKIGGRFVVFVYGGLEDNNCLMADRWAQANSVGAYVVLKVFPGYRKCANQPDGWHQYAPGLQEDQQDKFSFTISPGFWKAGEANPALSRDIQRWAKNIQDMTSSQANFQLITTFNEWGEGTAVESARQWASPSGYGLYLDALHYDGNLQKLCTPLYNFCNVSMR
jgi:Glycosyl hydrolase family 99